MKKVIHYGIKVVEEPYGRRRYEYTHDLAGMKPLLMLNQDGMVDMPYLVKHANEWKDTFFFEDMRAFLMGTDPRGKVSGIITPVNTLLNLLDTNERFTIPLNDIETLNACLIFQFKRFYIKTTDTTIEFSNERLDSEFYSSYHTIDVANVVENADVIYIPHTRSYIHKEMTEERMEFYAQVIHTSQYDMGGGRYYIYNPFFEVDATFMEELTVPLICFLTCNNAYYFKHRLRYWVDTEEYYEKKERRRTLGDY